MKILASRNRSNLTAKDICDHIILIVAAVMSDPNLQKQFECLESVVKPFLNNANDDYQWLGEVSIYLNEQKQ